MAFAYKPSHSKTWRIGFYDELTGKFKSISTKTRNEAEARRKTKIFTAEKRLNLRQTNLIKSADRTIKLSESLTLFFSQKNIRPSTKRAYQLAVNHFIKSAGDKYLYLYERIDAMGFNSFLNAKTRKGKEDTQQKITTNTKANYTRHLYALFQWLHKNKFIKENIIEKIKSEKLQVESIPPSELAEIFTAMKDVNLKQNLDLIKLKYFGAFRAEELLNVCAEDIDLKAKVLRIRNFKGNRVDEIPMVTDLYEHLQQMDLPKTGRITKLSYNGLRSVWRRVMARLLKDKKIKTEYSLHHLRKARGTDLANSGVSPFFLHKFMRHENIKTTMDYYIKVDLKKMEDEINSKL